MFRTFVQRVRRRKLDVEILEDRLALSGVFTGNVEFAAGSQPWSAAVGDFNDDGKLDVVVANRGSGTVSVLLNTTPVGTMVPTFAAQQSFAVVGNPQGVTVGDFNDDGLVDLAIVNTGPNQVSILLNTSTSGAMTVSFAAQPTLGANGNPNTIAVGDFNGDDKPDLVASNANAVAGASTASVYLNLTASGATTATFTAQTVFTTGANPNVAVADYNGDGKLDLAFGNSDSDSVSVLLNETADGATTPDFAAQQVFPAGNHCNPIVAADINHDGKPDLVIPNLDDTNVSVLLNTTPDGATTVTFAAEQTFAARPNPTSVGIADFDLDGKVDVLVANGDIADVPLGGSDNSVSLLINTTPTSASSAGFLTQDVYAAGNQPRSLAIGDFNGDTVPDVVIANLAGASVSVLLNKTVPHVPTTLFVTNTDDSGAGSLRNQIAAAHTGDTIAFQTSGTIGLLSGLTIDKNLTIDGPGDDTLTISGSGAHRIFAVAAGIEAAFDGLILRDGVAGGASGGGAILGLDGAGITVTNCTFLDNTATAASGGAIAGQANVALTVHNSAFEGNTVNLVDASGGAIANSGTLIVCVSTFTDNAAWIGGAIAFNGSAEVKDSQFTSNDASGFGGAIYTNLAISTLEVAGSTFHGNTAGTQGGAIYNLAGVAAIATSTFTENASGGGGGALMNDSGGSTMTVERSTFAGNTAATNGAAIESGGAGASLTVVNCTFSDNAATGAGGGIASGGTLVVAHSTFTANTGAQAGGIVNTGVGTATIYNTIVVGNNAPSGPDFFNASGTGAVATSLGNNLYGSGVGIAWLDSDLQTDDAKLGTLQDNGGPTHTIALLPGSPALKAGNTAAAPATDQRGYDRVVNGAMDIGAWQNPLSALSAVFSADSPVPQGHAGPVRFTVADAADYFFSYDFDNDGTFEIVDSLAASALVPASYLPELGAHVVHGRLSNASGFADFTTTVTVVVYGPWESLSGFVQQTVAGTSVDGSVALFAIGGDNAAWLRLQDGPDGAFQAWTSLDGFVKQLAVGRNQDGRLVLFAIGGDNAAWMRIQNADGTFAAWTSLGGFVKQLTVGRNDDGRLLLFGIGGDNAAWMRVQDGAGADTFTAWSSLGGFVKQLTVGENLDGRLALFGIGGDNAAWVRTQDAPDGAFAAWTSLGGFVKQLTVGTNADGRLALFAIGGDNAAWMRVQDAANGAFNDWTSLGGFVKQLTVGRNGDGSLSLMAIGGDNAAWLRTQQGPSDTFAAWTSLGGFVKQLTAVGNADGTLNLFAIGGDNAAWLRKQQAD